MGLVTVAAVLAQSLASAPVGASIPLPPTTSAEVDPAAPWVNDPFVREAAGSLDFARLSDRLERHPGFLALTPDPATRGYVAHWRGAIPSHAPRSSGSGRPVLHSPDAKVRELEAKAHTDAHAIDLSALEQQLAAGLAGPGEPGPVQGIGPGGAIQMQKADAQGNLGTYICSASYLFQDPATGTYYLATAGHCLLDAGVLSTDDKAEARARWVRLCYEDCISNYFGVGSYVQLKPGDAYPGYHPVAWAEQRGPGRDFGFIEIPSSLNELLRPWLWFWGGPKGFSRPALGDPMAHYGFGIGLGQAFPTQGRLSLEVTSSKTGGHAMIGWVNGGDSGSAFGTATVRANQVVGDSATGTITHAIVGVGAPLMWGTDMEDALDHAQISLGFRPLLVNEDGSIEPAAQQPAPSPSSSPSPSASPKPTASPSPSSSPSPRTSPSPSPSPTEAPAVAERNVSLRASRSTVRTGRRVRLSGQISGPGGCLEQQVVQLWARRGGGQATKVARVTSDASGGFAFRIRPRRTRSYRVVLLATESCSRARSRSLTIKVR